jgi:tRNA(fMet)-specific endonuclease VapC
VDVRSAPFYLLDTNTAGYIVNGRSPSARRHLQESLARERVALSAISEAEIRYGLELKPGAVRLRAAVEQLLGLIEICAWESTAAQAYGRLRARLKTSGKPLSGLDLMIAAHAVALGATLVSHDRAFRHAASFLTVVDWAGDL